MKLSKLKDGIVGFLCEIKRRFPDYMMNFIVPHRRDNHRPSACVSKKERINALPALLYVILMSDIYYSYRF